MTIGKLRIMIVVSHLGCGGTERVCTLMANYWAKREHDVYLMTLAKMDSFRAYPVPDSVHLVSAQEGAEQWLGSFGKMWAMRKKVDYIKPDVVISFHHVTSVLVLLSLILSNRNIIVTERNHPDFTKPPLLYSLARKTMYSFAKALVVQTDRINNWFLRHHYRVPIFVIPNPLSDIDNSESINTSEQINFFGKEPTICSVGSLTKQKGHERLVKIFYKIHNQFPDWKLAIVGEGPERVNLEALINKLHLNDAVQLVGRVANPFIYLNRSKIFAFTSYYEGFPNALCEAMAVGLPVISFDCPSGPAEIIEHGKNGMLIPDGDEVEFEAALKALITDHELRERLGQEAKKIKEKLAIERIMQMWEHLIEAI